MCIRDRDCIYIGNIKDYIVPQNENNNKYGRGGEYLCLIEEFEKMQIKFYEEWKDVNYYMNY